MTETLNHVRGTHDHGENEPGQVQKDSNSDEDPVLDSVAPEDVALPERDLLVDGSGGSDLSDAVLELAFGAEVVAPDRGKVTESRGQQAGTEDIGVTLADVIVGLDLSFPGQLVTGRGRKQMMHMSVFRFTYQEHSAIQKKL